MSIREVFCIVRRGGVVRLRLSEEAKVTADGVDS